MPANRERPKSYIKRKVRPIRIDGDVAYVTLTKGLESIVDAADVPLVAGLNWQAHRSNKGPIYARRTQYGHGKKVRIYLHRIILGDVPHGHVPHHKDGDGLNNRRSNLEIVTASRNVELGAKGQSDRKTVLNRTGSVRYVKREKRWIATIYFGSFSSREKADAMRAWAAQALQKHNSERPLLVEPEIAAATT